MAKKNSDFESDMLRLQEIASEIANNDINLEKSSKLYEEGMKLSKKCREYLDEQELKIEQINNLN